MGWIIGAFGFGVVVGWAVSSLMITAKLSDLESEKYFWKQRCQKLFALLKYDKVDEAKEVLGI